MKRVYCYLVILLIVILTLFCSLTNGNYTSWHLAYMRSDRLWEYSTGDGQIIAFIDTGLSSELLDAYEDRIIARWNIIENNADVIDYHGHGTEMVSAACGDGYKGQYGISPNAGIVVIKAVSDMGVTNNDYLYEALLYARESGATIVNISLGGFATDDKVSDLVHDMIDEGIVVVCAAGDYGNKDLLFPASISGVVSVEALDEDLCLWDYSNRSDQSVVRAPGVDIHVLSFDGEKTYATTASGTSQSAAIVSGYLALVLDVANQKCIKLNNDDIINYLSLLNSKTEEFESDYLIILKLIKQ